MPISMTIQISNLAKRFHHQWIFRNLTLELNCEKSYAVTGPNGSGKTTLLQVLAGIQPPTKGTINYESENGKIEAGEFYKHLTYVAPYLEMIEEFTLQEFLKFHFSFKLIWPSMSINHIVDDIELTDSQTQKLKTFSSGMKQRVKLALSFYSISSVIFLDEPTANLDQKGINWYLKTIDIVKSERLIIIASNQPYEYEFCQESISLADYK